MMVPKAIKVITSNNNSLLGKSWETRDGGASPLNLCSNMAMFDFITTLLCEHHITGPQRFRTSGPERIQEGVSFVGGWRHGH